MREVCIEKDVIVRAKDKQISKKDQSLTLLTQRCGSLQTQLERVKGRIQSLEVSGFASLTSMSRLPCSRMVQE